MGEACLRGDRRQRRVPRRSDRLPDFSQRRVRRHGLGGQQGNVHLRRPRYERIRPGLFARHGRTRLRLSRQGPTTTTTTTTTQPPTTTPPPQPHTTHHTPLTTHHTTHHHTT